MWSRRERIIFLITLAVVGLFVMDRWMLTPLLQQHELLGAEKSQLLEQLQSGNRLLRRERHAMARWRELAREKLPTDASEAESRLLHAVRNWGRDAGTTIATLQPDRPVQKGELREVELTVSATGTMEATARFLFLIEQAEDLPVQVKRLRLAAKEGQDQLALDLRLSTLYRVTPEPSAAAGAASTGGNGS